MWRALPAFEGRSSLKTFVAGIAHKRAATHVGRALHVPRPEEMPLDLPDQAPLPDEHIGRDQQSRLLLEAIQTLPVPQKQALILALKGFSYAEIAEALGTSAGAAMNRVSRAKATLMHKLRRAR